MPKFYLGLCPTNVTFDSPGWRHFPVFDLRRMVYSFTVGFLVAACLTAFWSTFVPGALPLGSPTWWAMLLVLLLVSVGHELLHLLAFPNMGLDENATCGIWKGSPYVHYALPMRRNRFLIVLALPFLVLSVLPIGLVLGGFLAAPLWSWVSVLNGIAAGSDILIFLRVLATIPQEAAVVEKGQSIYFGALSSD